MDIQFQVTNEEDIHYLNKVDTSNRDKVLRTALSIGLKSIQMSEVNMDCHSYIEPIKDLVNDSTEHHKYKLYSIESKLDDLLHIKTNSSRKGRLSEDICRDILTKTYPSWSFLDVSQEGYGADCRAFDTPVGQILFEFKSYDHNVNRDQISKFIRDLDHTNIQYGIFVSNTSGIVGKKNIEWEIINNKLVVYVSNMGLNGYGCILGTELLLSLIEINILDKDKNWLMYQNIELDEVIRNISENIDQLRNNIELYTKHKILIADQRIKINQSLDILEKSSFDCLLELNHTMNQIIKNTQDIKTSHQIIEDRFEIQEFIDDIPNTKFRLLFSKLIKCCSEFELKKNNSELIIVKNNSIICYTLTQKSKLLLVFPLSSKKVQLDLTYEKIKGNEIHIELKDDPIIWTNVTNRLNVD